MKNNYHFVISTERSDEKFLIQTLRFLPSARKRSSPPVGAKGNDTIF